MLRNIDMMPEERLPRRQRNPIHFAAMLPMAIDPKTPFNPKAPMTPQRCQMLHQMGVCEPTIRGKDDTTPERKQLSHLIQHPFIHVIGDATARVFQDDPDKRDGPSTIHERN